MAARVVLVEDIVHDIVSIIIEDPIMVQSKERFYNSLGLPPGDLFDLQSAARCSGGESYSFFSSCLHSWISKKGLEANYDALVSILRKESFGFVADKISRMDFNGCPTEPVTTGMRNSIESDDVSTTVDKTVTHEKANKEKIFALESKWWPEEKLLVNSFYERNTNDGLLVEELFKILTKQGNQTAVISQKVTVSGFGGIGKTTMVKWYAKYYDENYDHIIWIDCGEGSLFKSFIDLSDDLKVERRSESDLNKLARTCFQTLEDKKCLFIFDNAERYVGCDGIRDVLPKNKNFHSIITSRNREWGSETGYGQIQQLPLDVFSTNESISFLNANLKHKSIAEKDLKQLCDLLGNLPLALQIATSTLNKHAVGFADYIKIIQGTNQIIEKTFDDYEKTINATLNASLEFIKQGKDNSNQLAYKILLVFGYIQPDKIPISFFQAVEVCESWEIQAAMDLLETYSLVSIKRYMRDNEIIPFDYSIHRLLQQVIRYNDKNSEEATLRKILASEGDIDFKVIPYSFASNSLKEEFPKLRAQLVDQLQLPGLILSHEFEKACLLSEIIHNELQTSASRFNHAICLKNCKLIEECLSHLHEMLSYVSDTSEDPLLESSELVSLRAEPTKEMVGSQIFSTNLLKGDTAKAMEIFELVQKIQLQNTEETLNSILRLFDSMHYENCSLELELGVMISNNIYLSCNENKVGHVSTSERRNLRSVILEYVRFSREQSESLSTGNFFPFSLTKLEMMKSKIVDDSALDDCKIILYDPWICLNQLEYLQTLKLTDCTITLTDVPLQMRLESLYLENIAFVQNGELLRELILNEFINFGSLKTLMLTRERIEYDVTGKKELWLVDMAGNLNLDFVRLQGNGIVCQNWEDANWTIDSLILENVELKSNKMKIKDLYVFESSVELSDLPRMIQSLSVNLGVSVVRTPQACFLQNLKYLAIRPPFSLKSDILGLFKKCPNLVGLKLDYWLKEDCEEFDLSLLPSTVRELHLNNVRVTGDQDRHLERLVLCSDTTDEAKQILTKLRPVHLCYKKYFPHEESDKFVDLIQCQFKSIVLGPVHWSDFKKCELSSYVDEEGKYYLFQNHRGTSIDADKFNAYFEFPPVER